MTFWQEEKARFDQQWTAFNAQLADLHRRQGLAVALDALYAHQHASGFIGDDLSEVVRYRLDDADNPENFFSVQYNPRRALRFNGAGRRIPPWAAASINQGCFLCRENIFWQQEGRQLGLDLTLNGADYVILTNPFPLMPNHMVLATRDHRPQECHLNGDRTAHDLFRSRLGHMLSLIETLPGYLMFYNGVDAGASIPHHLHFQLFARPHGHDLFPLEKAARHSARTTTEVDGYPLPTHHWRGNRTTLLHEVPEWIFAWVARNPENAPHLSSNLIATVDDDDPDHLHLYFTPRTRRTLPGNGKTASSIGGLEVLGELVLTSPEEKAHLDSGELDYREVQRILGEPGEVVREAFPHG